MSRRRSAGQFLAKTGETLADMLQKFREDPVVGKAVHDADGQICLEQVPRGTRALPASGTRENRGFERPAFNTQHGHLHRTWNRRAF